MKTLTYYSETKKLLAFVDEHFSDYHVLTVITMLEDAIAKLKQKAANETNIKHLGLRD